MLHKLGCFVVALGLALPAWAAGKPAAISGTVRSADGVPQMGAMVELLGSALTTVKAFTDEHGAFSMTGILPGTYNLKISEPSFLPTLREKVGLRPGSTAVVNVTLNTIFDAIRLGPPRTTTDDDDWKWVLRSAANRPILRMLPDGSAMVVAEGKGNQGDLRGTLSFVAGSGSEGYGGAADMSTGFSVEKSMFATGTLALRGNVGYGPSSPEGVLRASYSHKLANGSEPVVALTMRRLASPDASLRNAELQALALTTSDSFALGDLLELQFGSELQTIQFMGRVTAFRPFGSADLHLSPNMVLEYRYATSTPDGRSERGFESAPADFSESGPHVTMAGFRSTLERAHHHEVSLSRRAGKNNIQLAVYSDHITDPALTGVGAVSTEDGNVLPDIYSGTFSYRGRNLDTHGMRVVVQRKVNSQVTATLNYAYGGVLDLDSSTSQLQNAREAMTVKDRQTIAGKVSGTVPVSKTQWIASYGWTSGPALTPVDEFNASAGQTDPFFDIFFRQPIPSVGFIPARMEALIDVRNLLAQGYVPVLAQDGRTVYLVQSARAVRGGVAFTF